MENITRRQADRFYTILVETIGSPNDWYLRWSFIQSLVVLQTKEYYPNSYLGIGSKFCITPVPHVVLAPTEDSDRRKSMVVEANAALRRAVQPVRILRRRQPTSIVNIPIQPSVARVLAVANQILNDDVPVRAVELVPPVMPIDLKEQVCLVD